jgi:XTP/dITP diphosphohydrolase
MKIYCISENQKKLNDYRELQKRFGEGLIEFAPKALATTEIQSIDGEKVVLDKMAQARRTTRMPFIVDDVSLLVGSGAYPGALVKHLLKNNDLATLSQFLPDDTLVTVVCHIGYFDGFDCHIFKGEVQGRTWYGHCDAGVPLGLDTLIYVNGKPLEKLDIAEGHRGKAFSGLAEHVRSAARAREEHNGQVADRWNGRADSWQSIREDSASYVNHEDGYERFDAEVRRVLPLVSGSALDIGCGDGAVTRLIAEHAGITDIVGIDISQEMVRVAAGKTADRRIRYEVGTFSGGDARYGLITSRGVVLSHMHRSDVIPTLTAMAESLSENGYLVFDYISNIDNNDDAGRMPKNQLDKEWLLALMSELGLVHISYSGSDVRRVSTLVFHRPTPQSLYFATSNATKVLELQSKCRHYMLHLANIDVSEIKNDDIAEIAKDKAKKSYEALGRPVIVTDGGIFINALKGFPGPNSKQAATLLGPGKILALLEGESDRSAIRRNCMVFYDGKDYKVCVAEVPLLISDAVTDSEYHAYPMDAILIPAHDENPQGLTYKQMPVHDRVQFTELPFFEKFISTL